MNTKNDIKFIIKNKEFCSLKAERKLIKKKITCTEKSLKGFLGGNKGIKKILKDIEHNLDCHQTRLDY